MGGRSGQAVNRRAQGSAGGNTVTQDAYERAAQNSQYVGSTLYDEFNKLTINAFTAAGYQVNYAIRDGDLSAADKQYIENLDKALEGIDPYTGTTYRGLRDLDGSRIENLRASVGGELSWSAYSSILNV